MVSWLSMSKKSGVLRWPSRCSLPVVTLAALMLTETAEFGGVRRVDVGGALELVELAAHGGDHRVAGRESDAGVAGVDHVVAGDVLDGLVASSKAWRSSTAVAVRAAGAAGAATGRSGLLAGEQGHGYLVLH